MTPDLQLVWQAADRVLKMGYPNDLTEEERLERYVADASLCAACIQAQALHVGVIEEPK